MRDTKTIMMEKATDLFAEKGVQATSIRDITEACGLTKGAFYNHYSSKEELLTKIIQFHIKSFEDEMTKLIGIVDAKYRLFKQIYLQFAYISKHQSFFIILNSERFFFLNEHIDNLFSELDEKIILFFQDSLQTLYPECTQKLVYNLSITLNTQVVFYTLLQLKGKTLNLPEVVTFLMILIEDIKNGMVLRGEQGIIPLSWDEQGENNDFSSNLKIAYEELSKLNLSSSNRSDWLNSLKHIHMETQRGTLNVFLAKQVFLGLLNEDDLRKIHSRLYSLLVSLEAYKHENKDGL
ncbi:TetR/AcrR family transcriptional regulator [Bacillus megaterium]|nr:TetR/AcrR family transcriptional regulator [Priestia megaterium]